MAEEAAWTTESEDPNDDDVDFELPSDGFTSTDDGDDDDIDDDVAPFGEQSLYYDAEDGVIRDQDGDEVQIELDAEDVEEEIMDDDDEFFDGTEDSEMNEDEEPEAGEAGEGTQTPRPAQRQTIAITQQQILQLLSQAGIRGIFQPAATTRARRRRQQAADDDDAEDDDDDDDMAVYLGYGGHRLRRNRREFHGDRYPKIPSEEGQKLMTSGTFGHSDVCAHSACGQPLEQSTLRKRKRLARRVLDREMGVENRGRMRALNGLAAQDMIPGSQADLIINLNARCYSGQFSEDGSFFFACGQDFKVRMYDTSNPYDWKYYKTVDYYGGQWTITDATLSPDNKRLAYSSIRSQVCMANTERGDTSEPQLLDFSDMGGSRANPGGNAWARNRGHFGIWSLRFSGDGNEIVAGTGDHSVYVYDLETQRSILQIPAHTDDVNAVCFGDRASPHILYSGSDDTTLKVWDRRSLASMRPAGMFLGHTEGLTYIDSKGDGRYVISNAKDQTCKLWDLRKMISTDRGETINPQDYTTNFDYRFTPYDVSEPGSTCVERRCFRSEWDHRNGPLHKCQR